MGQLLPCSSLCAINVLEYKFLSHFIVDEVKDCGEFIFFVVEIPFFQGPSPAVLDFTQIVVSSSLSFLPVSQLSFENPAMKLG